MAQFIILWYDNFGENHTPLQRNGMTAIPKMYSGYPLTQRNDFLRFLFSFSYLVS